MDQVLVLVGLVGLGLVLSPGSRIF